MIFLSRNQQATLDILKNESKGAFKNPVKFKIHLFAKVIND